METSRGGATRTRTSRGDERRRRRYAAALALCCVGTRQALDAVDRRGLYRFLSNMKDAASGGFRMHDDGEVDVRGTYFAARSF